VRIVLRDGRAFEHAAHGARGYPERPANDAELEAKFTACAARVLPAPAVGEVLGLLGRIETLESVRTLSASVRGAE
jgi:hypothetical protein